MWKDRLKKEWNERPLEVIVVAAVAASAAGKMLDVMSSVASRRAYAKQVNYKVKR